MARFESSGGCSEWHWAAEWFGDPVCEPRDKIGFIIGLVSVVLWALAEVPQLVINAIEGSSDGLSEGLLWLWVFSDVLDVLGCSVSDTLPTMLITAWMYFIFTLLLLAQHIYYTHTIARKQTLGAQEDPEREALLADDAAGDDDEGDWVADLEPPLLHTYSHRQPSTRLAPATHIVYGSLRNLSIRRTSSSSSLSFTDTGRRLHDSFVHRVPRHRALPPAVLAGPERLPTADAATIRSLRTAVLFTPVAGSHTAGKVLAGVSFLALAAVGSSIAGDLSSSSSSRSDGLFGSANAPADGEFLGISYAVWGAIMGWTMAVTFFMGRVPQVIKNWRRKSCAGLSVEMFLVVFSAAVTYCASILIRARSWSDLAPKLPFLTDAAVGGLLDLVILAQFLLYRDADDTTPAAASETGAGSNQGHAGGSLKSVSAEVSSHGVQVDSRRTPFFSSVTGRSRRVHDMSGDKLPFFSSLLAASPADISRQPDCGFAAVAAAAGGEGQLCAGVVADTTYGADALAASSMQSTTGSEADYQHVDILVVDHQDHDLDHQDPDQGAPEVTVSTSLNEDALSLSSAATV